MKKQTRWSILILSAVTNMLTIALPTMSLSVLFKEISTELGLDLVQVGLVWSISALPGMVSALLGGMIGDRFGPKGALTVSCLLLGIVGALRGAANDFLMLVTMVFFFGFLTSFVSINTIKTCRLWFPQEQAGLANGFLSMGMALGFLLGSFISASYLSPWLGSWRYVLVLYGVIAALLAIPWYLAPKPPVQSVQAEGEKPVSMRQGIGRVARMRDIWLLGFAIMGIGGGIQGLLGYLPLYLRGQGWQPVHADSALGFFHTASLLLVMPLALGSDQVKSRKQMLFWTALMILLGIGSLSFVQGPWVWVAVCVAGMVRDGFMAIFITMIGETEGVGARLAGTATGFVMIFSGLGNLLAPPVGNSLAKIAPNMPFVFWAVLAAFGILCISQLRKAKQSCPESTAVPDPSV